MISLDSSYTKLLFALQGVGSIQRVLVSTTSTSHTRLHHGQPEAWKMCTVAYLLQRKET